MRRAWLATVVIGGAAACTGLSGLADGQVHDAGTDGGTAPDAGHDTAAPGDDASGAPDAEVDAKPRDDGALPPSVFKYRRRITIENAASSPLPTGATITVPIDLAALQATGKALSDLSDVRVLGDGTLGERDRVLDPPAGPAPAAVHFSLPSPLAAGATSTDWAIYYGDAKAGGPPADGTKVFVLYDDFGSGISSIWLKNDGPIAAAGALTLRAGHQDALTTIAVTDNVPIVSEIEASMRVVDPTSDPDSNNFYYWLGYQHTGDFSASDPWALWIARGKGQAHAEQKSPVGCESECDGPYVSQTTNFRYYAITRDPSSTTFSLDAVVYAKPNVTNRDDMSVMIRNWMLTSDVQVDWIRARSRVSPDPTVTLGPEETL